MLTLACSSRAYAGDLGIVPLLDGERNDLLNLWGGPLGQGSIGATGGFTKQSTIVRSGSGAYRANLGAADPFEFFQTFSSAVSGFAGYRQDRDLTQYQMLEGYVRNDTTVDLTLNLELKDYRDLTSQSAVRTIPYTIPTGGTWTKITAPLDLGSGWTVTGTPDLTRTFALSFLVNANAGAASGSIYLDDFTLKENGPSIDVATAPIQDVVERIAKRQFMGLWAARNKTSGLIPNSSDNIAIGAMNTTTGVVWNLPVAIRRGWVTQSAADVYMSQLVTTLNTNRNQTMYLPSRMPDLVTGAPTGNHEESSIDAAFIYLALDNYKHQAATPAALRTSIQTLQNRFDFSEFAGPGAFKQAYFQPAGNFGTFCGGSPCTYSGYTNENKVIALAAALSTVPAQNVPLASMWNKDTGRTLTSLVTSENYLNYSFNNDYRAAFEQALLNLFVDTSARGADNYPTRSLARNPWENFVRSEADIMTKLQLLSRGNFAQPDAGFGLDPNDPEQTDVIYKAWNLFSPNNFGQPYQFQPWSVAEALMAGAPGAEAALRFLLDNGLGNGLDGPQGLADWALWPTGASNPTSVPSFADNWNITLSTMAFLEFLEGSNRQSLFFANLPEVRSALDSVFIAGDFTGNGVVDAADYNYWRSTFGSTNSLAADGNNNGVVDGADYVTWRKHLSGAGPGSGTSVPEPAELALTLSVIGILTLRGSRRRAKA